MRRFLVVIEKADGNYSAYSPDLPGCVATGETRAEAGQNLHEAIQMHVQELYGSTRAAKCLALPNTQNIMRNRPLKHGR